MKDNILFIVIDCLRSDRIIGEKRCAKTPNIDKLKQTGKIYPNTISSSTSTGPCFGSLMTGLYPYNHGLREMSTTKLRPNIKTIGEIFHETGYNTYAEVSGPLTQEYGIAKGFEEYNHRSPSENLHSNWYKELIEKFKNNHFKEPWLIFFHIWDLHQPRMLDRHYNNKKYGQRLYDQSISSIDNKLGKLFDINKDTIILLTGDHGEKLTQNIAEESIDRLKKIYYPTIRWKLPKLHDKFNKAFWKFFRIQGEEKEEFSATHGYQLYRELITTPLIISHPNFQQSKQQKIIRHVDILPSLCDHLNIKPNLKFDGYSIFNNNSSDYAYSELFLDHKTNEKNWLVSLLSQEYQIIYQPFGKKDELYIRNKLSENEEKKKEMKKIIAEINPETKKGLKGIIFKNEMKKIKSVIKNISDL